MSRQFFACFVKLFVVFVDRRLSIGKQSVESLDLAILIRNLSLVGLLLLLLSDSFRFKFFSASLGALQLILKVRDLAFEVLNSVRLLISLLKSLIQLLLLFGKLVLKLSNFVVCGLEVRLLHNDLVLLFQRCLLEVRNLFLLLFDLDMQLRFVFAEHLLICPCCLELLRQVPVRYLLLVQFSASELKAVLSDLQLLFQFFDLLSMVSFKLSHQLLVLLLGLASLGFRPFLELIHVLLVSRRHLCEEGLMVFLDDD